MKKALVVVAVLVAVLSIATTVAAKPSKQRLAVTAVKEAVQEKYPQFTTVPAYVNVSKARVPVSCKRLSRQKFKCNWKARNYLDESAWGGARVTVYGRGGDARLYNVHCEKPYGRC